MSYSVFRAHDMGIFRAHVVNLSEGDVVGPIQDPSSRMCSTLMLWTKFKAAIVGHARSLCWQTCESPVLWDVFKAHVEERVGNTVVGRVQGSCGGSCPGHVL